VYHVALIALVCVLVLNFVGLLRRALLHRPTSFTLPPQVTVG